MTEHPTIRDLLARAMGDLSALDTARLDAEVLLMHVLDKDRAWLFAHPEAVPDTGQKDHFETLVNKRKRGEPVAYLTGVKEFWSMSLEVTPDVLIPRPETELLVETALMHLANVDSPRIIDLGTGSGAIALALASERPDAKITATDCSSSAIRMARRNARHHGLTGIQFVEADWFGELAGPFDAVISNPPYVAETDPHLASGDCRFEPRRALTPGADPFDSIRTICREAPSRMSDGALLALEHGWDQGRVCYEILQKAGFVNIAGVNDLAGLERITLGFKA